MVYFCLWERGSCVVYFFFKEGKSFLQCLEGVVKNTPYVRREDGLFPNCVLI